mmetsp:Transcript_7791/g.18189  ORF Transcript_7791/g.18189 Transcript_7791/m.18189 type:complete len:463 (-) Transcript_7791:2286-3674(-)
MPAGRREPSSFSTSSLAAACSPLIVMTRCAASVCSDASTAARKTADLMAPPVRSNCSPSTPKSTSSLSGVCLGSSSRHSWDRAAASGRGNSRMNLKRRWKAVSICAYRLVMATTMPPNVSMWWSSTPTFIESCRDVEPPSLDRSAKRPSDSSKTSTASCALASSKTRSMFFADSPTYLSISCAQLTTISGLPMSKPTASAARVLPVPGSPWKSAAIPCARPCCFSNPHCPKSTACALEYETICRSFSLTLEGSSTSSSPRCGTMPRSNCDMASRPRSWCDAPAARSACETVQLTPSRATASESAESHAFLMKPPGNSYLRASAMKSTSSLSCSLGGRNSRQMRSRSSKSGFENSMARVMRLCIASSRSIGRFVARTQSPSCRSSSVSTVFTCRLPLVRSINMDSHSSKKSTASWIFASRKTTFRMAPAALEPSCGKLIISTFLPIMAASALASMVLPVPDGP